MLLRLSLVENILKAEFEVRVARVYANAHLSSEQFPYMYDVVEFFLSVDGSEKRLPYFEFELSPLGQTYELTILTPRENVISNLNMGVQYKVIGTATGWTGVMDIPLKNLGWSGDPEKLVGNAYAILGEGPERKHWSLFALKQEVADFHKPELFGKFFS